MMHVSRHQKKWIEIFEKFIADGRIQSKEVAAEDERGAVFNLWGTQRYYLEQICDGLDNGIRDFRCLKGRQQGITTVDIALCVFWLAFFKGITAAFVSDTEGNCSIFRELMKKFIESYPPGYFGEDFTVLKGRDNRFFTGFSNGNRIDYLFAGKRNKTLGESRGYNLSICTEVANYGDPSGLQSFRETLAVNHPDRLFLYESTAKSHNHWYLMCQEAEDHPETMRFIFTGWYRKELNVIKKRDRRFERYGIDQPDSEESEMMRAVRERYGIRISAEQLAWYREKMSEAESTESIHDLFQNQPWVPEQAFVLGGTTFFQPRALQNRITQIRESGLRWQGFRYIIGNDFFHMKLEPIDDHARIREVTLRVWEEPVETGVYVIGADPSYGRSEEADEGAISVWRAYADKLIQVAEFADRQTETRQFAWILAHLAGSYRNCEVNIELTGPGRVVVSEFDTLKQILRTELYAPQVAQYRDWENAFVQARDYIYRRVDTPGSHGYVIHFETTWRRKMELMNQMRDSHSSGMMIPNSIPLLEEMGHMIQARADIAPSGEGMNDDRVFAAALANRSWVDNVRMNLIVQGLSWARVQEEESGMASSELPRIMRHQVWNFFRRVDEEFGYDENEGLSAYMRDAPRTRGPI